MLAFVSLCTLLVPAVASNAIAADSVATGAHFRVEAHFANDAIAKAALETAEATWPLSTALYGAITLAKDERLVIHLHRDTASYERAEASLTKGRFKDNLSFTHHGTRTAHVALQPDLADETVARVGLTLLTRECIAHEAVHITCGYAWTNWTTLPDWFAEGSAMWIAQEALVKGGWRPKLLEDPLVATDARRVQLLLETRKLPSLADVFEGKLDALAGLQRYAVWGAVYRFLRDGKNAATLGKLTAVARSTGGGEAHTATVARSARELFGGDAGLAKLDAEFASYVTALTPRWQEIYRSLAANGDTWTQTAFANSNALAWRTEAARAKRYQVSGAFELLAGRTQQLNVLLGRTDWGLVQISFNAGNGVTVFEYDNRRANDAQWKQLAKLDAPAVRAGASVKFAVRVDGTKLSITVDGARIGEADADDHPLDGAWGVGALAGTAGVWTRVQLERP